MFGCSTSTYIRIIQYYWINCIGWEQQQQKNNYATFLRFSDKMIPRLPVPSNLMVDFDVVLPSTMIRSNDFLRIFGTYINYDGNSITIIILRYTHQCVDLANTVCVLSSSRARYSVWKWSNKVPSKGQLLCRMVKSLRTTASRNMDYSNIHLALE